MDGWTRITTAWLRFLHSSTRFDYFLPPFSDDAIMPEPDRTNDSYPEYRSHYRPRTRHGWTAVILFVALFALTQPPFVSSLANRIEPTILGMPFLYVYLLVIYVALIGVLIWARRRDV